MPEPTTTLPSTLTHLSTLQPSCSSRTWLSAPHPHLPLIATACSDKTVRVYSLTSFTLISTISGGHKRSIRTCAWKPNTKGESVLATGSFDASAGIWRRFEGGDAEERDFTSRFSRQKDGYESDGGIGDHSDADADSDEEDYRFAVILDGHESEIKSVAWSAGGQYLATCSRDKSVWIWEEMEDDNFETIAVLQEHEGDVKCVAWHPEEDLLASSSYDDSVRLYREDVDDWTCVSVLKGHEATVWCVDFEPAQLTSLEKTDESNQGQKALLEERRRAGPRLVSSSDDLSIKIWRRKPKERPDPPTGQGRIPSIIRSNSIEEEWVEEARLPARHERAVYSVAWSKRSGRIVSTGSDGRVIVYEERWKETAPGADGEPAQDGLENGAEKLSLDAKASENPLTEWVVVAEAEAAHDVFEVNHVCWARRADRKRRRDDEEVIVTTGDDGEVRVWVLD